jgi:polysaccharide deacetylase family protein (PEP-CTERM system associated)
MTRSASPRNVFTVDVEEWFHVCGVGGPLGRDRWEQLPSRVELTTNRVLDLLDAAGITATFFIVGWIAERFPRLVERIRSAGHELGSHGYAHERAYDLGPDQFLLDLRHSVAALTAVGVPEVRLFRAPEWSINGRSLWALDGLTAEGFVLDASMAPLKIVGDVRYPRHPHMRRTTTGCILEVPPLVADRFGQVMPLGWGWGLRMSSPRRILAAIEAENRRGRPAVFTVHPWEIDPEPPRVRLPAMLQFAHYFRLGGFDERLREILGSGVGFGPIGEVVAIGEVW